MQYIEELGNCDIVIYVTHYFIGCNLLINLKYPEHLTQSWIFFFYQLHLNTVLHYIQDQIDSLKISPLRE